MRTISQPRSVGNGGAVGIYGADLDTLDRTADQIAGVLGKVDSAEGVKVATPPQTPVRRLDVNFVRLAHYGLSSLARSEGSRWPTSPVAPCAP